MKNSRMLKQATGLLLSGLIFAAGALYAQDGKKKDIHTEKKFVSKHGNDSTVTIIKEDATNGHSVKKTIVIHNGDTSTNVIIENTTSRDGKNTAIIVNGDSIVKLMKEPLSDQTIRNKSFEKKSIIIINGDTMITSPEKENLTITVDTSVLNQKFKSDKTFQDAMKKGFSMNDKIIVINMNKFNKKDSAHSKPKNVTFDIGLEGFDLGFTQFIDNKAFGVSKENNLLDLNVGKSVNVNFRVVDMKINLIQRCLYLNAGLEFDLHDYRFNNNVTIKPNSDVFTAYKDSSAHFSKDKLSTQYLELPVMLFVNTDPKHTNKSFRLGLGGYYGILLGSYTKQISTENGKQHYYGDFQCNPIDYGVMAELGYGGVDFFAKYNMSSLFETNKGGPDLQSVTFGIKLFHPFSWRS